MFCGLLVEIHMQFKTRPTRYYYIKTNDDIGHEKYNMCHTGFNIIFHIILNN